MRKPRVFWLVSCCLIGAPHAARGAETLPLLVRVVLNEESATCEWPVEPTPEITARLPRILKRERTGMGPGTGAIRPATFTEQIFVRNELAGDFAATTWLPRNYAIPIDAVGNDWSILRDGIEKSGIPVGNSPGLEVSSEMSHLLDASCGARTHLASTDGHQVIYCSSHGLFLCDSTGATVRTLYECALGNRYDIYPATDDLHGLRVAILAFDGQDTAADDDGRKHKIVVVDGFANVLFESEAYEGYIAPYLLHRGQGLVVSWRHVEKNPPRVIDLRTGHSTPAPTLYQHGTSGFDRTRSIFLQARRGRSSALLFASSPESLLSMLREIPVSGEICAAALTAEGDRIAVATLDGKLATITVYSVAGEKLATSQAMEHQPFQMSFLPNELLATQVIGFLPLAPYHLVLGNETYMFDTTSTNRSH